MAKKGKGLRTPVIKNIELIRGRGKGTITPILKDGNGNPQWAKSFEGGRKATTPPAPSNKLQLKATTSLTPPRAVTQVKEAPVPIVKQSKLQQAAKSMAAKLPPKPTVKKSPAVKPPGK